MILWSLLIIFRFFFTIRRSFPLNFNPLRPVSCDKQPCPADKHAQEERLYHYCCSHCSLHHPAHPLRLPLTCRLSNFCFLFLLLSLLSNITFYPMHCKKFLPCHHLILHSLFCLFYLAFNLPFFFLIFL